MTSSLELLRELYPEWDPQIHPFIVILLTLSAIAFFTVLAHIVRFNESKPENEKIKYECDSCGGEFEEPSEFCPHCGVEFEENETPEGLEITREDLSNL